MDMAWLPLVCTVRLGTPVYRRTLVSPFLCPVTSPCSDGSVCCQLCASPRRLTCRTSAASRDDDSSKVFPLSPICTATHHLHPIGGLCYNVLGKRSDHNWHTKNPRATISGAFLFPLCRQGLTPRLVAFFSSVKPFAKIVADYPRQNGEHKRIDHS